MVIIINGKYQSMPLRVRTEYMSSFKETARKHQVLRNSPKYQRKGGKDIIRWVLQMQMLLKQSL